MPLHQRLAYCPGCGGPVVWDPEKEKPGQATPQTAYCRRCRKVVVKAWARVRVA